MMLARAFRLPGSSFIADQRIVRQTRAALRMVLWQTFLSTFFVIVLLCRATFDVHVHVGIVQILICPED